MSQILTSVYCANVCYARGYEGTAERAYVCTVDTHTVAILAVNAHSIKYYANHKSSTIMVARIYYHIRLHLAKITIFLTFEYIY